MDKTEIKHHWCDAQTLWEVYAKALDGKTFDGKPLPKFQDLGSQKKGWKAVADFIKKP